MKNKIFIKLIMYFSAALLLFSVIIGSIFMTLFRKHTIEYQKTEMEKKAQSISTTLSQLYSSDKKNGIKGFGNMMGNGNMMGGNQNGFGPYMNLIDKIAMTDVWIVDENLQLLTMGNMSKMHYKYNDLPEDADKVVKEVFQGETTFSEGFSRLLDVPTLTIGKPIKSGDKIIGALLLHSPVSGIDEAVNNGFNILVISIFAALILSAILSVILALSFTKPLKKIKGTALKLAAGEYGIKTNIKQDDEIGELASTIDILSQRLDFADKESQKLQKLRRDFTANISHELRTPVTVIRGSLEALCDGVISKPDQIKSYHSQMLVEIKSLERLVNDLLDLSRLQNTDFNIEKQELNLPDIIKDVVRSASNIAKKKNVNISYKEEDKICPIIGDYGRLRQMFLIILDNAVKFSPENGIVDIIIKKNVLIIRDKGTGIDEKDIPYIFDRFYKVKSEENKNGTGLGLAIAKQISERHNISISVSSEKNKGTEFIFRFNNQ